MGYTKEEWAQFAENRQREVDEDCDGGNDFGGSGEVCINCGAPVGSDGQIGEEAAICGACD